MASPRLELPASSRGGSLKAGQVWARLAHIRAATHQEPCQIGPLSRDRALPYWRRTWLRASRAFSLTGQGCLLFPRGGSLPCWLCTRLSGGGSGLLQQVLPQGRLPLSWGCGREHRHAGSAQKHLHISLLGRRVLGNLRLSYNFWAPTESASGSPGLKTPARGPGSLVLSVRSFVWAAKEPLKEPCCCPSLPSDRAFTAGALGSVQPTSP